MKNKMTKLAFFIAGMNIMILILFNRLGDRINYFMVSSVLQTVLIDLLIFVLYFIEIKVINLARIENNYSYSVLIWRNTKKQEKALLLLEGISLILSVYSFINNIGLKQETNVSDIEIFLLASIILLLILIRCHSNSLYCISSCISSIAILLLIIGLGVVTYFSYINADFECRKSKEYSFATEDEYERCKRLYNQHYPNYVVLSTGNNSIWVRNLTNEYCDVIYCEDEKEFKDFIEQYTMGIDVTVPILSGRCSFDDMTLTVSYEPVFGNDDIAEQSIILFKQYSIEYYIYVAIVLIAMYVICFLKQDI